MNTQSAELSCHKQTLVTNYQLRQASYLGRNHIVAPVVMMVEGVHSGSKGPTLYRAGELAKFTEAWNGRPVPVRHPENNQGPISCNDPQVMEQYNVGQIFNCHFEDGKLKGEIWIDEERAKQISPVALSYIRQGRQLEVSTGVFTEDELIEGEWNGEMYQAIAHNLRPDHLALLPGDRGACSWEDGCGVRVNQRGGDSTMQRTKPPKNQQQLEEDNQKQHPLSINQVGEGYRDILDKVQRKLDSMDDDYRVHLLEELYDDSIIYKVENRESDESRMYKRNYSIQEDGTVELGDDPVVVTKEVSYKEVQANNKAKESITNEELNKDGGINMPKVDELINNTKTQFTEDDREWLSTLTDCQLFKLEPKEEEASVANAEQDVTKEQAIQVLKETITDNDQFINLLPSDMQEQVRHGLKLHKDKRQECIQAITANSQIFTEDELKGKDIEELQKLATLVQPKTNYSLGVSTNSVTNHSSPEPLMPVGVEINQQQ